MKALPTLKQLHYLIALADEQHFSRAADAVFVTQSTLSAGIKELEAILGVELAERTKRSVMLTPIGRQIAERARLLLRDTEDIVDFAAAARAPLTGDLALGIIPTIGPFLLPQVLPRISAAYPELRLYLREDKTEALIDRLVDGRLDAVLMAFPYPAADLATRIIADDPFRLACACDHKLATRHRISEGELAGEPLMLLEEGHCLRDHALSACHLDARQYGRGFEATSLQTLIQMVAAGLGITLLPELAVAAGVAEDTGISLVELTDAPSRQIGLAWRRTSARAAEFELLAELLKPA
ncbi:MAG: hydrogen peroxide-inducible genes activator [Hyphomicrobiales bacterium]|nr:hydrogen peroxide-inducible genes activator [Hyphomicrobiales bacterium]